MNTELHIKKFVNLSNADCANTKSMKTKLETTFCTMFTPCCALKIEKKDNKAQVSQQKLK